MKIKWLSPLDQFFGPVSEFPLQGTATVAQVLTALQAQQPALSPYARFKPGEHQPYGLMVWRRGKILTLSDELESDDEVEMIVMVAGG